MKQPDITRGEAGTLPFRVRWNGEPLDITLVDVVEVYIGDVRKVYPNGGIEYDSTSGFFLLPLTQQETFGFPGGNVLPMIGRVKLTDGTVRPIRFEDVKLRSYPGRKII